MKALVYTRPLEIQLQEIPIPEPGPGEVLVRVRAAGICGSEVEGFLGKSKKRVPPLIMGHEFAGEVAALGKGVSGLETGIPAAIQPLVSCGECPTCKSGRTNACPSRRLIGMDCAGGFAEYAVVPADSIFPLQEPSFRTAALAEPLANAVHVMGKLNIRDGADVLIVGAGFVGLACLELARRQGAGRVFVIDPNPHRRRIALKLGAFCSCSPEIPNAAQLVASHTTDGFDAVIDASGAASARSIAAAASKPGGIVVLLGQRDPVCELDFRQVIAREITLMGSYAYTNDDYRRALELATTPGALRIFDFVSEVRPDSAQAVFEDLTSPRTRLFKPIFIL